MREAQTKVIDGLEYTVTPLGAGAGLKMLAELLKMLGPVVENITVTKDVETLLRQAFGIVSEKLDGDAIERMARALSEQTRVRMPDGKQPVLATGFDAHFAGNYMALGEFLVFALEVNFADFFRQLVAKLPKKGSVAAAPATSDPPSPSPSPVTSPGSSGSSGGSQNQGDFIAR